jgi:uncharacterized membrane protein HdeD (DUF308 family)
MLTQLLRHRWIFLVQGGLTFLLGLELVGLRPLLQDQVWETFVAIVALLSTGFVLALAGLLDLAVAVGEAKRQRALRSWMAWCIPGAIGLAIGLFVVLSPGVNMRFLAFVAAAHALVTTGIDLAILTSFNRHTLQRNVLLGSALIGVCLGVLLAIGGRGTEDMATRAIGLYALYFGLRLTWLGFRFATGHQPPVHVS